MVKERFSLSHRHILKTLNTYIDCLGAYCKILVFRLGTRFLKKVGYLPTYQYKIFIKKGKNLLPANQPLQS